jgi:S1-C subfamily serine protease
MKKLFASIFLSLLLAVPMVCKKKDPVPEPTVVSYAVERAAVGAIFIPNPNLANGDGIYAQICSGSEVGYDSDGNGLFLTAKHCVWEDANPEQGTSAQFIQGEVVSFADNSAGPYYQTELYAISATDDLAVLKVFNAGTVPTEVLEDEHVLKAGDPIENVSYPLDMGKLEFHGGFVAPRFPHWTRTFSDYPQWINSMPVDITIAHGSSGSPIFDSTTHCVIGVLVGTTGEGRLNVAEPISLYFGLMQNLDKNSVDAFLKAHPLQQRFRMPSDNGDKVPPPIVPKS